MPREKLYIQSARGGGKTTALMDLAIMNAMAGQYIQVWCATLPRLDSTFGIAVKRLQAINCADGYIETINGVRTLTFKLSGGRIEFHRANHDRSLPTPDMSLHDGDYVGTVIRNG